MKRLVGGCIGAGLAGVAAMGCAGPTLTLVKEPAQQIDARGFSVTAPHGSNWYVMMPIADRVFFAKRLGDALVPTVAAAAWITTVKARPSRAEDLVPFKQHSIEELQQWEPTLRIELRDVEVDRSLGAECVRWVQEEDQRSHPDPALRAAVLVTTTHGLDCLHPLDSRSIITIGYSERRIKGATSLIAPDQLLAAEGEAFVHSLRFMPPR
jgi:hypothetical protein